MVFAEDEPVGSIATCVLVLVIPTRTPLAEEHGPHCHISFPVLSGHACHMFTCRRMASPGKTEGPPFLLRVKVGRSVMESVNLLIPLPADLYL